MTRRVWALARKEIRQLFASPIAYVVLTVYVALTGIYFFQHLVSYNQLLFFREAEVHGGDSIPLIFRGSNPAIAGFEAASVGWRPIWR